MSDNYYENNKRFSYAFFVAFLIFAVVRNKYLDEKFLAVLSITIFIMSLLSLLMNVCKELINRYENCKNTYYSNYEKIKDTEKRQFIDLVQKIEMEGKKTAFEKAKTLKCDNLRLVKDTIERLFDFWGTKIAGIIKAILLFVYFALIAIMLLCLFLPSVVISLTKDIAFPDFTILSLVIILFQLLIEQPLIDFFYNRIYRWLITRRARSFIKKYYNEYDDSLLIIDKID